MADLKVEQLRLRGRVYRRDRQHREERITFLR
jgi:hypothetical protein